MPLFWGEGSSTKIDYRKKIGRPSSRTWSSISPPSGKCWRVERHCLAETQRFTAWEVSPRFPVVDLCDSDGTDTNLCLLSVL